MLQCAAVCCSVLQCVAVCCSVLVHLFGHVLLCYSEMQCVAVLCGVVQCVAVCCSVLVLLLCQVSVTSELRAFSFELCKELSKMSLQMG